MDKVENFNTLGHVVTLSERKNIVITGVKKIESFDNEEFLMETNMGFIVLKGEELEIIKLDTYQGSLAIKGTISSVIYLDNNGKKKSEAMLARLFK